MCGPLFGSFWWIFPMMGFLMCVGFLIMAFRFASTGRGFMCMSGRRHIPNDQVPETRR